MGCAHVIDAALGGLGPALRKFLISHAAACAAASAVMMTVTFIAKLRKAVFMMADMFFVG